MSLIMFQEEKTYLKLLQRFAILAGLAVLLLAAGSDWARAATLEQLDSSSIADIWMTVLLATGVGLLTVVILRGRIGR